MIERTRLQLRDLEKWYSTNNMEALNLFTETGIYPIFDPLNEAFTQLVKFQVDVAKQEYDQSTRRFENTLTLNIGIINASIIIAI